MADRNRQYRMRFCLPWFPVAATIGIGYLAASGQTPRELQTSVRPLPNEEILHPCEYRMALPDTNGPIKAVWVIFDRGQDYLQWYRDRQIRAFARDHRLALVLAAHCRSKEREDMIVEPEKGVGRALFTALEQFAISADRSELKTVSIIAMGWSGADQAGIEHER